MGEAASFDQRWDAAMADHLAAEAAHDVRGMAATGDTLDTLAMEDSAGYLAMLGVSPLTAPDMAACVEGFTSLTTLATIYDGSIAASGGSEV